MQKKTPPSSNYFILQGIAGIIVIIVWLVTKNAKTVFIALASCLILLLVADLISAITRLETPLLSMWSKAIGEFLGKAADHRISYLISIAHPQKFSKQYTSPVYVNLYFPENRHDVELFFELAKNKRVKYAEKIYNTPLLSDIVVKISLSCPVVEFSQPVVKKLNTGIIFASFVAKPFDDCHPGRHAALISITDNKTSVEYFSMNFEIDVVDFVFDHISRPLLANISTIILGISSLASFILATIGKLDASLGLTAGTTAGIIAATIQAFSWNMFNSSRVRNRLP